MGCRPYLEQIERPFPAAACQKMTSALQVKLRICVKRDRAIGSVDFFFNGKIKSMQFSDWFVVRNVADLKARAFNVPRSRVFHDIH